MANDRENTIGVIGAGPAGMMAAYQAAEKGAQVWLIERNQIPGRKLRITGAGRGNLTNNNVAPDRYHCSDPLIVRMVLDQFSHRDLISFLHALGIFTYFTDDGWCYPITNSAANVVDLFTAHLKRVGVNLLVQSCVYRIRKVSGRFEINLDNGETLFFDRLILAAGGKAYPNLGSNGNLFPNLQALGHQVNPINPALAPILTDGSRIHKLQGVRLNAAVSLSYQSKIIAQTFGNIIFTSWGLNGPAVMDLSHFVHAYPDGSTYLHINFLGKSKLVFEQFIERYRHTALPAKSCLDAVLPPKASQFFLNKIKITNRQRLGEVSDSQLSALTQLLEDFRLKVMGTQGFDRSQLSTGGVPLQEVDGGSMSSKIVPGLFLAGEILDIVGPCGGYNLQWAFSSGYVAGKSAAA